VCGVAARLTYRHNNGQRIELRLPSQDCLHGTLVTLVAAGPGRVLQAEVHWQFWEGFDSIAVLEPFDGQWVKVDGG
jgi:hypothetical protein